ncbi:MAG: thiosulfate oxidation carrier protein SoxY [Gammaproteobacteria bacterium]
MNTSTKRRLMLKGVLGTGLLRLAAVAGVLNPLVSWAWPKSAFESESANDALQRLLGTTQMTDTAAVTLIAPPIAENGAVVPVSISTNLKNVESITIIAENNPFPLIANFQFASNMDGFAVTRIKMSNTSDVIAVVKAGGKLYSARQEVKVTIGGCGG